jgi:1,4-dihydroxy-2-naphthoate octaprenyltransferase
MPQYLQRALFWFKASRPEFFTGSIVPIMVGGALAYHDRGYLQWGYLLLSLLALILLHATANLANDYYDHLSGNDEINTEFATPFTGGSRVIQQGKAAAGRVLAAALICMAVAALIGIYLAWVRGWVILLIGVIGGLSGFFYTAKPLQLGYRGFGEIFIGLDFGVLPVLTAYYVQVQHFSWSAFIASLPVAFLIMAILWINQFQDFKADKAVNKLHWVVRLGRRRASYVYTGMMAATYLSILVGVFTGLLPPLGAIALLAVPVAIFAVKTAVTRYDDLPRLTPANAATVVIHLATGILLTVGVVVDKWISRV